MKKTIRYLQRLHAVGTFSFIKNRTIDTLSRSWPQVPTYGEFGGVHSLEELAAMPQWTEENPLRVVTGYTYVSLLRVVHSNLSVKHLFR